MSYKLSKYCIQINRPEGEYLWNTYSNALIRLNADGKAWIESFDGTRQESPYFDILKENECIVDERLNETGRVLYEEQLVMRNPQPDELFFTIAPGLGCNYRCPYCFENGHGEKHSMDVQTMQETVAFIMKKAENDKNLKRLNIRWFGGEPLLYMDTIRKMSVQLMDWCAEHGTQYSAGIVTNGRYLTKETAKELRDMKVSYVQLSMDGMGKQYEQRKGAAPGDFDAVTANLKESADFLDITVRINVSDDLTEAKSLTEYLLKECGLEGKIRVYLGHIRDYEGMTPEEERESHTRFLELEGEYLSLFGQGKRYSEGSLSYIRPARRCTTCVSVCGSNFCIGPEGELYRCEHHFGQKEQEVGTVSDGLFYSETEVDYLGYRHPGKCLECRLFPICLSGCMNDSKKGELCLSCESFQERQIDYLLRGGRNQ